MESTLAKRIFFSISMILLVYFANAQSNLIFYHTPEQFNSSAYNPAFLTSQEKFTFSIFPVAGMDVGYNNQALINKMIFNVLRGDTSQQLFKDVFNGLVKKGLFYQKFESTLLTLGYNNSTIGSFNFRVREVEQFQNNFKGPLTDFLVKAESQTVYIGQPQPIPAQLLHYREYSLGYAKEVIKDKLIVGVRAKLYFGKASFASDVYATTAMTNDTFHIKTAGVMNISAPVKVVIENEVLQPFVPADNFSAGNYILNAKNIGSGFDLGIIYKINNQTELSASVTDLLGKISWKNNLNTLNYKGDYIFPAEYIQDMTGVSLTKGPGFTTEEENNFDLFKVDTTKQAFSTNLPATFYLGVKYQLNPRLNIGFVDRFTYLKGMNQNSFGLLTTYELNKKLKISTGYTAIGNSFFNIPFGLIYHWNGGQSYIGSDNIFSFVFPSTSDFSGVTFGTCFYLFREKVKYMENDYLPFYERRKVKHSGRTGRNN